ncbi:ribosome hibernation-promoting factor, HPF/YfiA family [Mycolicibacterium goodii]|uniref:Ribosome hibernation promoting factor n=1 Tax=Mycolicibacterium goodii TaxID=134601 RepID=A0ABS6HKC6_MYCGD|nr:ribosome-associated translation inhibitor RaiA [Mycolicibacterium goodii]OKH71572.1 30S ribosomal protein S30 [Mycobacterium sp. SWH-M5]MBU8809929.1 ribosome-associated translation inhibitor RaiA [Mycolicibacterium goodii]MBU8820441.1 ribosome-associated translation inhibitor RaiA [Mycolicibacterium goodii]MBU8823141.1 ribosome-associated translation inhibitor RaiA [Mycolicibacterium goodii]MBU8831237.1 ribosome-associated translation inhibitor RaiA [Mycolicibacterium goodii]
MSSHSLDSSHTMVVEDDRDSTAGTTPERPHAEVVVKGRNVEVPDHFRTYVSEKLSRLERFDKTIYLFDVELDHERNRRQRKNCQHVEITARGRGPVVRGEACADSFYAAFESAVDKLEGRLRRAKDRRKIHYGDKTPVSLAEATAKDPLAGLEVSRDDDESRYNDGVTDHEPGRIVRIKDHPATPMTVDDALYEMELVGHDFFLFHDKETDKPSVVYRRHAFDYGLIRLA